MKKLAICLSASAILIMASCTSGAQKEKALQDSLKIAELTANFEAATSFNDSLMLLMADVYNGIDSINMQEGLLYNMGNGENQDRRMEIRHNLSAIKSRLATNRKMLDQMEKKLRESGNQNAVLTSTIEQMKTRIEQQDAHIAMLENKLSIANDSIVTLNNQVAQVTEQVQVQTEAKDAAWSAYQKADAELNTVYYALGTNKELKSNGLLEKKFLGATKVMKGDFNESYFTKADKRELKSIPTGAKKIKIWTNMPKGSYNEVKNADGVITIEITNPKEFWSLSPFLLIQTD